VVGHIESSQTGIDIGRHILRRRVEIEGALIPLHICYLPETRYDARDAQIRSEISVSCLLLHYLYPLEFCFSRALLPARFSCRAGFTTPRGVR
jgi:hypothetical protein